MSGEVQAALDAAQPFLPHGYRWLNLAYAPVVFVVSCLAAGAGAWIALQPLRRVRADDDWVAHARHAYVASYAAGLNTLVLPLAVALLAVLFAWGDPLSLPRGRGLALTVASAAYLGALPWQLHVYRRVRGTTTPFAAWCRGYLATWLFFRPVLLVALVVLAAIPSRDSVWARVLPLAGAVAVAILCGGGLLALARALGMIVPASDRLRGIAQRAAEREGVRLKAIHEGWLGHANALALPLTGEIVVAREAVDALSDDEIAALCAHEVGHLGEPRRTVVLRILSAVLFVLALTLWPALSRHGVAVAVAGVWVPLAILAGLVPLWRRLEVRSDEAAHRHQGQGHDGRVYARALEHLHKVNRMPPVLFGKGQPHPHLYERMIAAGVTPDYPRPAPPSRGRLYAGLAPMYVGLVALTVGLAVVDDTASRAAGLAAVARQRFDEGDVRRAAALWRAAVALDSDLASDPAAAALELVARQRCAEAEPLFEVAARRGAVRSGADTVVFALEQRTRLCPSAAPVSSHGSPGKDGVAAPSPFGVR